MGKKRLQSLKKDIGSIHVEKLGIRYYRNEMDLINSFAKIHGMKGKKEIMSLYDSPRDNDFYKRKNTNYDLAMHFSGGYDAHIIRDVCNIIYNKKEKLGNSILEIGCDCGFITTFLGTQFPDKRIVSIDKNSSSIEIAKINCEKLGVTNVEFKCCDIKDLEDEKFDTILSVRTMHENIQDVELDVMEDIISSAQKFANQLKGYANSISSLLKNNGELISIERTKRNAALLAWFDVLMNAGLNPIDYSSITCKELGDDSFFPILIFAKEKVELDSFEAFMIFNSKEVTMGSCHYKDLDADIMFAHTRGEKIIEANLSSPDNTLRMKQALYVHKFDDTCVLNYRNKNGNTEITYHDISTLDEQTKSLKRMVEEAKSLGWIVDQ